MLKKTTSDDVRSTGRRAGETRSAATVHRSAPSQNMLKFASDEGVSPSPVQRSSMPTMKSAIVIVAFITAAAAGMDAQQAPAGAGAGQGGGQGAGRGGGRGPAGPPLTL